MKRAVNDVKASIAMRVIKDVERCGEWLECASQCGINCEACWISPGSFVDLIYKSPSLCSELLLCVTGCKEARRVPAECS